MDNIFEIIKKQIKMIKLSHWEISALLFLCISVQMFNYTESMGAKAGLVDMLFACFNDVNIFAFAGLFAMYVVVGNIRYEEIRERSRFSSFLYFLIISFVLSGAIMLLSVFSGMLVCLVANRPEAIFTYSNMFVSGKCITELFSMLILNTTRNAFIIMIHYSLSRVGKGYYSFAIACTISIIDWIITYYFGVESQLFMANNTVSNYFFLNSSLQKPDIVKSVIYWIVSFSILALTWNLLPSKKEIISKVNNQKKANIVIIFVNLIFSGLITMFINIYSGYSIEGGFSAFYYSFLFNNNFLNIFFPMFVIYAMNQSMNLSKNAFVKKIIYFNINVFLSLFLYYIVMIFVLGTDTCSIEITGLLNGWKMILNSNYLIFYLTNIICLTSIYVLLSYVLYNKNSVDYIIYPVIIYNLTMYFPIVINNDFISSLIPLSSYNLTTVERNLFAHILSTFLMMIVVIILFMVKKRETE